jgi:glutamate-ammonia-ligase adenylyltransferase
MTNAPSPIRIPRAYHPDRGAEANMVLGELSGDLRELIANSAACSPYLAGLVHKEAAWIAEAVTNGDAAVQSELTRLRNLPPDHRADGLRQAKRRIALLTAVLDLGGIWPLETVTQTLSDFADLACDLALKDALAVQIKRGKVPGLTEDDLHDAGGLTVLAMGKMGAGELNYSSDIDLICLFDETRFDEADFHNARTGFVRATRAMCATLSDQTGEGYVFRTDLRLRPDPAVTPVCMAMEAAERYYESLGRTWERAAYIKARPCAGDLAAGQKFLKNLRPFVWRRHLDFAAIQDAHDMRLAIRDHKGLGGKMTLEGHNMKLGRGGIREIEFFTQTRQIIAGGRDVALRVRGTVDGLTALADKEWIGPDVASTLTNHYRHHRLVEHRLQMVNDAQTHSLPKDADGFERLAAMMDTDVASLRAELEERLNEVHSLTEGFFAPDTVDVAAQTHGFDKAVTDRWSSYPAFRSERAGQVFDRIKPDLFRKLSQAPKPDEALLALDGFLSGLPAGVQLFSLFEANPQLIDLLVDIVSTSPSLADHLARNSSVFDAVIGGDFFDAWPGVDALEAEASALLAQEPDYETQLDTARRWAKEWHFRIGVHLLRGLVSAEDAGLQYGDLARATLRAIWPLVCAQFETKHGPQPGRGASVLAMGSMGAGRLNAGSDLDLIVVYDPQDTEHSDGRRPLPSRQYYARLTQAMITALTAQMSQGRLYEVDMRLRPSGSKGPVATSWQSFVSYQSTEAWVWEHLALTRASVVAGAQDLAKDIETFRHSVLAQGGDPRRVVPAVVEMRDRIAAAKQPSGPWDGKIGPGRLQDIELFAQAALLCAQSPASDIQTGLAAAQGLGWLEKSDAALLGEVYRQCWSIQLGGRLLAENTLDLDRVGQGGTKFLLKVLAEADLKVAFSDGIEVVEQALLSQYAKAAEVISSALAMLDDQGVSP